MQKKTPQHQFNQAYQEVISLHIQIENLFHNRIVDEDRLPFLSYFHPNFTMIAPNGVLTDFGGLKSWSLTAVGSRPKVKISIENFKGIFSCLDSVIVTYLEYQQISENESLKRLSTAVFVPTNNPEQPLLWRHLHETWVNS
jgi:hypothetical protein